MGAAAALKSRTGRIGFIAGMDIPMMHEFQAGYEAGHGRSMPCASKRWYGL